MKKFSFKIDYVFFVLAVFMLLLPSYASGVDSTSVPMLTVSPISRSYVLYTSSPQTTSTSIAFIPNSPSGPPTFTNSVGPACWPGFQACVMAQRTSNDDFICAPRQFILNPSISNVSGTTPATPYQVSIQAYVLASLILFIPIASCNMGITFIYTVTCVPTAKVQPGSVCTS